MEVDLLISILVLYVEPTFSLLFIEYSLNTLNLVFLSSNNEFKLVLKQLLLLFRDLFLLCLFGLFTLLRCLLNFINFIWLFSLAKTAFLGVYILLLEFPLTFLLFFESKYFSSFINEVYIYSLLLFFSEGSLSKFCVF